MRRQFLAIYLAVVVMILATTSTVLAESAPPFTNLSDFFSMPAVIKEKWSPIQIPTNPALGSSGFMFSREVIVDPAGVRVLPKVAFVFEPVSVPTGLDDAQKSEYVVKFSIYKRTHMTIPYTIDKVYQASDGLFPWKSAIGYKVRYNDNGGMEHTVYWVHGLFEYNGRVYGAQVIMDGTTSVLPVVEPEFSAMLANIGGGQ